jgi:hypothetical protein
MNAYRKLTRIIAIGALTFAVGTLTPAFAQGHSSGGGHSSNGGGSSGGGHSSYSGGSSGGGHSSYGGGHSGGGHFSYGGGYRGGGHFSYGGGYSGGGHAHYAVGPGHFAPHYGGSYSGSRAGYYGGNWHGGDWHGDDWRGGYWHGGFYGPRFGFGWFLPVLPAFYATYYFGGIPYYYANDAYYTWNPSYNGYVATDPPGGAVDASSDTASAPPAPNEETYNYPKNGQTDEQQATDRYQCHQWAVSQSGYDPTRTNAATGGGQRTDYRRALTACLEGRGYSVR